MKINKVMFAAADDAGTAGANTEKPSAPVITPELRKAVIDIIQAEGGYIYNNKEQAFKSLSSYLADEMFVEKYVAPVITNEESSVYKTYFEPKFGEYKKTFATREEKDIKDLTGIDRKDGETYYEYRKRAFTETKEVLVKRVDEYEKNDTLSADLRKKLEKADQSQQMLKNEYERRLQEKDQIIQDKNFSELVNPYLHALESHLITSGLPSALVKGALQSKKSELREMHNNNLIEQETDANGDTFWALYKMKDGVKTTLWGDDGKGETLVSYFDKQKKELTPKQYVEAGLDAESRAVNAATANAGFIFNISKYDVRAGSGPQRYEKAAGMLWSDLKDAFPNTESETFKSAYRLHNAALRNKYLGIAR